MAFGDKLDFEQMPVSTIKDKLEMVAVSMTYGDTSAAVFITARGETVLFVLWSADMEKGAGTGVYASFFDSHGSLGCPTAFWADFSCKADLDAFVAVRFYAQEHLMQDPFYSSADANTLSFTRSAAARAAALAPAPAPAPVAAAFAPAYDYAKDAGAGYYGGAGAGAGGDVDGAPATPVDVHWPEQVLPFAPLNSLRGTVFEDPDVTKRLAEFIAKLDGLRLSDALFVQDMRAK